jgi:hypothetical protein
VGRLLVELGQVRARDGRVDWRPAPIARRMRASSAVSARRYARSFVIAS